MFSLLSNEPFISTCGAGHVTPPCLYSSPEQPNQTLALEGPFVVFAATIGSSTCLEGGGEGDGGFQSVAICNLTPGCHQILHTGPLRIYTFL